MVQLPCSAHGEVALPSDLDEIRTLRPRIPFKQRLAFVHDLKIANPPHLASTSPCHLPLGVWQVSMSKDRLALEVHRRSQTLRKCPLTWADGVHHIAVVRTVAPSRGKCGQRRPGTC